MIETNHGIMQRHGLKEIQFLLMNSTFFFITVFAGTAFEASAQPNAYTEAQELVEAYVNDSGEDFVHLKYDFSKYIHPDYVNPGSETFYAVLVDHQYTIERFETIKENYNLINPKVEDLIVVTVKFEKIATVEDTKMSLDSGPYLRTFYLSKEDSGNGYMILDMTDIDLRFAFIEPFSEWLQEKANKKDYWKPLLREYERLMKK